MTKKNILLAAFGTLCLTALFAFTAPKAVRENVFTLFFPEKTPPVATERPVAANTSLADRLAETVRDTPPPLQERYDDFINGGGQNPVDLNDPKAIQQEVEYDPETNMYIITEKIGDEFYRAPTYMTFDDYLKWREEQQQREYFDRLQGVSSSGKSVGLDDPIAKFDVKTSLIDRLFGGTNVDIRPQGNINLTFGYNYQKIQNPILTLRQQRNGNFDFDMDINMSATGKIGEKLNLNFNYNTQATFDIDNQMKLHYDTKGFSEDEIIQNIQAGNVSMPLRSQLIKGATNLFGVMTELKFGHLRATLLASQQRSRQQSITLQGAAQVQQFEVQADEYDENRHFFISHWNRGEFEPAMSCLPVPQSLFNITQIQVWITNDKLATENVRDIVALTDLAEPDPFNDAFTRTPIYYDIKGKPLPDNVNNGLYPELASDITDPNSDIRKADKVVSRLTNEYNLVQIRDFEKVRARMLSPSEFSYNEQLGFISINLNVQPDQVVGVALEYTYNGQPHKIGEITSDVPNGDSLNQNVLFVKMLKSTTANVRYPIWDLMMKNVYAIGSANVDPQEFRFDIFYEDPGKGQKRFLDGALVPTEFKSRPLLQVFNMDNLNLQGDPGADGIFDFVPGLTINLRSGRVMFPVLEPFGEYIIDKFQAANPALDSAQLAQTLAYTQLYDSTLFRAREFQQLNRYTLRGSYKSSTSSEISLGTFNLPQGSVRVSAGGRQLVEGADYIVDYNIGKIKILNDAILQSGQNVNVSFEDNTAFGFQSRTMLGARFDYELNKDVTLGATFMNLFERPLTQKVNFGDDPINNKMYGLDVGISKDAPWLTKAVDALPLISTKEPSSITAQAEVAVLQPGHNRAINQGADKGGVVYIDDFEGSTANLPLSLPANLWQIASVPQGDLSLFPEANDTSLALGANRARMSWYLADPSALQSIDANNPYARQFDYQDIFPNRQLSPAENSFLRPLDVTIYPRQRGPYNFEIPEGYSGLSAGLTAGGELVSPETRWTGFMKGLNTNDFEAANIEFIEFWILNPYMDKEDGSSVSRAGDMYIDLGTLSEDIMRDSRQFFENALPTGAGSGATANTRWGRIPVLPPIVNAFDNDPAKRALQDIGLDGLNDDGERQFPEFKNWLDQINNSFLSPNAKAAINEDPSNDNFVYFNDPRFGPNDGIIARYLKFNGTEGNSPVSDANSNITNFATNYPDREDFNQDNSLNETEAYFRYKIPMAKTFDAVLGQEVLDESNPVLADLITDKRVVNKNGQDFVFYRFKLPLDAPAPIRSTVNGLGDFRSIRFIRMLWKGFDERTTFRFATLELGRNQWRRFTQPLSLCDIPIEPTPFDVNAVSIEENSARQPFNYTIPPGISRENSVGAFPDILQNEQALALDICDLNWCDAKGIFKTLNMDLRQFDRLKMFVHAEGQDYDNELLDTTDLTVFIRLGSDFYSNYYEYEIPLSPSRLADLNGNNNPDDPRYKEAVWKPQNNFDFPLDLLTEVKKQRNADPDFPIGQLFTITDPENPANKISVVGNPNLGYVKGAMIGVRNVDPNKEPHCVEVWVNEMRLVGFNEKGGVAGLARVDMKLADFGNVSAAGSYTGIGWGSIEQKLVQRQREEVVQYDLSTNLELGKLLPEKSGIKVPFYAQYSNTTRIPEYDPYDLDIKLKDKLRETANPTDRDSIRQQALDVTTVRGFNFTNVRMERRGKKVPLPWDISNFSFTYAFNQQRKRNPFIINDQLNQYKGGIDYQYTTGLKPIQPFKKLIKNDKYLKFITEFNFNPIPNTYGFSTNLERIVGITTWRFAGEDPSLNTYYNRRFTWDRNYDLGWDISKSLRFNFDAQARSIIDEPLEFGPDGERVTKEQRRDSIWTNMRNLGRPKLYSHNASLNYTLPFKTIPFMDWITVKASYTAGYTWTAQSLKLQNLDAGQYQPYVNSRNLGNVVQNNSLRQINGDFNLEQLYNKSKYLGKINRPAKRGAGGKTAPGGGRGGNDKGRPGGADPSGSGLPGADPSGFDSKDDKSPVTPRDRNKPGAGKDGGKPGAGGRDGAADAPSAGGKDSKDKKDKDKKKKEREPSVAERIALRPLMLVRKARFTYSENYSTVIPGFTPETRLMGLSEGFTAPGWAFVAGVQPASSWLDEAARNGWITQRPELNQQVMRNYTQNFDAGMTVEPFQDFRIELNANRQYVRNSTELFKDQNFNLSPDSVDYQHRAARDLGSYTISYFAVNTLFNNDLDGLFARYQSNRAIVSNRLGNTAGNVDPHELDGSGYRYGYGKIQQEVLIPSFIAAYTDKDPNTVNLNIFKTLPAVNWKLNYNGLSKIGNLKDIFTSVQVSHGYKSTLTVNSYNTDIFYNPSTPYQVDTLNYNYIARYEIPQVVINEQFAPLFGLDVKLKNDMSFRADFKKQRTLAMSFIDYQLAETRSTSYSVGFGYRLKNVNIPFLTGKKTKKSSKSKKPKPGSTTPPPSGGSAGTSNDMNFKFDMEVRDDITVNHRLDQLEEAVPTRGARTISINPSVDYALNKRLKLRLFTDYRRTVPKTSQSFPITTLNAGVTVQFSLN